MSEPIPACITIGGRVPQKVVPKLCEAITAEGLSLEWGDAHLAPKTAEDLLQACTEHDGVMVLWLCDDQANYGDFPTLEPLLVKHGIPFDRQVDAKYEYPAGMVRFRPGLGPCWIETNSDGMPVVAVSSLEPVQQAMAAAQQAGQQADLAGCLQQLAAAQAALQQALPPAFPPLPPFEIG